MRLFELFEDIFTPPGLIPDINIPQANPVSNTANIAPNTANNAQVAPVSNQDLIAKTNQALTKGSLLNLPMGPNKQDLQMKVANNYNGNVTITNPKKPQDPALTYSVGTMANVVSQQSGF